MDVGPFFRPNQPNPHVTYLCQMQTPVLYRTRIFTRPLFREFLDHVSLKIKGIENVYRQACSYLRSFHQMALTVIREHTYDSSSL